MKRIRNYFFAVVASFALSLSFPVTASADPGGDIILEKISAVLNWFAQSNLGQFAKSIDQAVETVSEIRGMDAKIGGLLDFTEEMYSGARAAEMSMDNIRSAVNAFYGLAEEAEGTVNELKIYTERGWLTSSEFQQHLLMVKYVVNDAGLEIRYLFNFTQGPLAPVAREQSMSSIPVKSEKAQDKLRVQIEDLKAEMKTAPENMQGMYQAQISALQEQYDRLGRRSSYYGDFAYTDSQGNELNVFRNEDGTLRNDWLKGEGSTDGIITGLLKTVEARTEEIRQIAGRMLSRTEFLHDQRNLIWDSVGANLSLDAAEKTAGAFLPHSVTGRNTGPKLPNLQEQNLKTVAKTMRDTIELARKLTGIEDLDEKTAKLIVKANEGTSYYITSVTEKNEDAEAAARDLHLSSNGIFTIIYVLLGIMAIFFGVQVVIKMNKGEKQSQDTMFKLLTGTLAAIIIITLFREILF